MLENQCSVWPDPIAAAVYVPTLLGRVWSAHDRLLNGSSVEEAVAWMDAFASRMQLKGGCLRMGMQFSEGFLVCLPVGSYLVTWQGLWLWQLCNGTSSATQGGAHTYNPCHSRHPARCWATALLASTAPSS